MLQDIEEDPSSNSIFSSFCHILFNDSQPKNSERVWALSGYSSDYHPGRVHAAGIPWVKVRGVPGKGNQAGIEVRSEGNSGVKAALSWKGRRITLSPYLSEYS